MKAIWNMLFTLCLVFVTAQAFPADAARVVEFHTQKIGEVVHWMPEKISVKPGEKIKFIVKHELEGGFDFHGFSIRELDVVKQVNRNIAMEFEKVIPKDLKAKEIKVTCHFHPKHMAAAVILVEDAQSAPAAKK